MASVKPDFYFVSTETVDTIAPRACYIQQRLLPSHQTKYLLGYELLLVKIEPRLHWETKTSLGTIDADELVLGPRGRDPTGFRPIYPTNDWPGWVNVAQILNEDIKRTGKASAEDLRHILIGELWPTLEEAEKSLRKLLGAYDREPWI